MVSLKAKQILVRAAKLTQRKEEKINRREIEKKIHQIKYLAGKKKISKATLKKQINSLERQLKGVLLLEKKLKSTKKAEDKKIKVFKEQIKDLKSKLVHAKDVTLRRKVNKLSHMIGDMLAQQDVRKEIKFEKKRKNFITQTEKITIEKVYELKERLGKIRAAGKYPDEKIAQLEQRLYNMEKKLDLSPTTLDVSPTGRPRESISTSGTSNEPESSTSPPVKHKMLFGPNKDENIEKIQPALDKLEDDIDELPIPPPPRIKKKK